MPTSKKSYTPVTTFVKKEKKVSSLAGWEFYFNDVKQDFPAWRNNVKSFLKLATVRCAKEYNSFIAEQYVKEAFGEFKAMINVLKFHNPKKEDNVNHKVVFTYIYDSENESFCTGIVESKALGYIWKYEDKKLTISFETVEEHEIDTNVDKLEKGRPGKVENNQVWQFKLELDEMKRNRERMKGEWETKPLLDEQSKGITILDTDQDEKVKGLYKFNLTERAGVPVKPGFNDELLFPEMKLVNVTLKSGDKPTWVATPEKDKGKFIRIPGLGENNTRVAVFKLTQENAQCEGAIQFLLDIKTGALTIATQFSDETINIDSFYIDAKYYTGEKKPAEAAQKSEETDKE